MNCSMCSPPRRKKRHDSTPTSPDPNTTVQDGTRTAKWISVSCPTCRHRVLEIDFAPLSPVVGLVKLFGLSQLPHVAKALVCREYPADLSTLRPFLRLACNVTPRTAPKTGTPNRDATGASGAIRLIGLSVTGPPVNYATCERLSLS